MDPSNMMASLKAYEDGIQDAGIIANDLGLWPLRPTIETKSKNPGLTITITPEHNVLDNLKNQGPVGAALAGIFTNSPGI
jgi:hypothetical protein